MTVFLTPALEPFYGGTYFPPEDRQGMPGLPRILLGVAHAYRNRRGDVHSDAARIAEEVRKGPRLAAAEADLRPEILDRAAANLLRSYDEQNGGFGTAPKFPPSFALDFLLRSHARTGSRRFLDAAVQTLEKMAGGGIYDQLGGGFHRYSVDARWRVPHFEKMLYDNALLSRIYLHAWLLTGTSLFRRVAEETLAFVMREMTSPEGGFYSTLDADSEGEEGRFYTWERREALDLLGEQDGEIVCRYYGVSEAGDLDGRSVLHVPRSVGLVARLNGLTEEKLAGRLERAKKVLFEARETRPRPALDTKILASWNGMMLKSLAEAAVALDREDYRGAAVRGAEFLCSKLRRGKALMHAFANGEARIDAFLDDYACVADALLSVYEATFDTRWMAEATSLAETLVEEFPDPEGAGFFFTARAQEIPVCRPKELYDQATPSGNSVAAHLCLRLAGFSGGERWSQPAMRMLRALSDSLVSHPAAFGNLLCALDLALDGTVEIAILGDPRGAAARALLREVHRRYLPNRIVACGTGSEPAPLRDKKQAGGRPTAYLCRGRTCSAPATRPAELAALLDQLHPRLRSLSGG
jgi:uncharacterized protein YyaL (SSP411 family)